MGSRGVAISLALLAAIVAVGAVRDLSSYSSVKSSALDFVALDFRPASKVVKFYEPRNHSLKVVRKPKCGAGKVVVSADNGYFKCINKKKGKCEEWEILEKGPDGKLVCVFSACPETTVAQEGPDGKTVCAFACPEGFTRIGDLMECEKVPEVFVCPEGFKQIGTAEECEEDVPFVCPEGFKQIGDTEECEEDVPFTCPEGFKQIGDTEECEEDVPFTCPEGFKQIGDTKECEADVPEVKSVTVPAEPPIVEEPVVEAVVVPEEEATAPAPSPAEPIPEEPVPVEPVPVEPVPEVEVEVVPEPVEPVPETPVEEPVPEEPVPEVEVQVVPEPVEPEAPGACPVGEFFMEKVEVRGCQPCDKSCGEGSCVDLDGCDACLPGYFRQREDVGWPYECVLCESVLPGCGKCKDDITLELGETPQCEA
ncbi:hypothetical protein BSKO_07982 [Bryopsis sp. KO-2023]|nr:hypothetical protein BSKO_07982 [Bryopsis sp. KO-2023]